MVPDPEATRIIGHVLERFQRFGEPALQEACRRYPALADRIGEAARAMAELLAAAERPTEEEEFDWSGRTIGRYRVGEEVGRGGMGLVYRAFDPELHRPVALKVLAAPLGGSPEARARFRREARALGRLRHPAILPVHEVGETGEGLPFLAMGLVAGESLQEILGRAAGIAETGLGPEHLLPRESAAPPPARSYMEGVAHLTAMVAGALHQAHGEGVIHRDVKPGNILVDGVGKPFLVDFGIAHLGGETVLTATGSPPGTPAYMAPEQVEAKGRTDERTDVYGLGATLFFCLTRRTPFRGESRQQVLEQVRRSEPPLPRRLNPEVPRDLETICLKAMAKEPERRYPSAREMGRDLERFLAFRPVKARPLGPASRALRTLRRNPLLAALVLVVLVGGPLFYGFHARSLAREKRRSASRELYRLARQAGLRGDWQGALACLDSAEKAGFEDPVLLDLGRVEALEGSLQAPRALALLEELVGRADQTGQAARIHLLQAEYAVNRWRNPEEGLDRLRADLGAGAYTGADAWLARAMLAGTVAEAKGHLRRALAEEPYNRAAIEHYGNLLLVKGELSEAVRFAALREYLHPDDPVVRIYSALVHALDGGVGGAAEFLAARRDRLEEGERTWVGYMFDMARVPALLKQNLISQVTGEKAPSVRILVGSVAPILIKSWAMMEKHRTGPDRRRYFRMLPVIARGFRELAGAFLPLFWNRETGSKHLQEALVQATMKLGDGIYPFGLGLVLLGRGEYRQALAAFRVAERRPSMILTRKFPRLYRAATLQCLFGRVARDEEERVRLRRDLVAALAALLAEPDLTAPELAYIARQAAAAGDLALEAEAVTRWRREHPRDREAERTWRGMIKPR